MLKRLAITVLLLNFCAFAHGQTFTSGGKNGFIHYDDQFTEFTPCNKLTGLNPSDDMFKVDFWVSNYFPGSIKIYGADVNGNKYHLTTLKQFSTARVTTYLFNDLLLEDNNGRCLGVLTPVSESYQVVSVREGSKSSFLRKTIIAGKMCYSNDITKCSLLPVQAVIEWEMDKIRVSENGKNIATYKVGITALRNEPSKNRRLYGFDAPGKNFIDIYEYTTDMTYHGDFTYNAEFVVYEENGWISRYFGRFTGTAASTESKPPTNGYASFTFDDGTSYTGNWSNGMLNGKGKCTYPNGNVYEGEWKNDQRYGQGKMMFSNGDMYEGKWKYGERNGQGTYTWPNGAVYTGQWVDDQMKGKGKMIYADGGFYEGEWEDSKRNGFGTLVNKDIRYEGNWRDGNAQGEFVLYYADGRVAEAVFEQGKIVSRKVIKETADYEGIGIVYKYNQEKGYIIITLVGENTPAEAAGLMTGDIVVSADGVYFNGKSSDEIVSMLKGPSGSTVNLGLKRNGLPFTISVKRGKIAGENMLSK